MDIIILKEFIVLVLLIFIGNVDATTNSAVVFSGPETGFSDISLNNSIGEKGHETKWMYKYTARAGQKLSIHFFTKLEGNVDIKVYDGPSNACPTIDISPILNNPEFSKKMFSAPFISSTGEDMLVEITALQPINKSVVQDFQAIVTDHQNKASDGCDSNICIGFTVGAENGDGVIVYNVTMNGNNCINILRAVDLTNNPTIVSNLEFHAGPKNTKFYKNLKIADNNELLNNVKPFQITDRNVLLVRSSPLNLYYNWDYLDSSVTIFDLYSTRDGSFMTRDYLSYLPSYLQTPVTQTFTFTPYELATNPSTSTATIEFTILKNIGNAKLTIQITDYISRVQSSIIINGTDTFPMTFNMTGHNIQPHRNLC